MLCLHCAAVILKFVRCGTNKGNIFLSYRQTLSCGQNQLQQFKTANLCCRAVLPSSSHRCTSTARCRSRERSPDRADTPRTADPASHSYTWNTVGTTVSFTPECFVCLFHHVSSLSSIPDPSLVSGYESIDKRFVSLTLDFCLLPAWFKPSTPQWVPVAPIRKPFWP